MMMMNPPITMRRFAPLAVAAFMMVASVAPAQLEQVTEQNIITGTMDIVFNTRTEKDRTGELLPNSPARGAQDVYTFNMRVATTTEFAGTIRRQPNLYSSLLRTRQQNAQLEFDINVSVLNPRNLEQKRQVGKWVGLVPINTEDGSFNLAGGREFERPLRMAIDTVGAAQGFTDNFSGRLVGKAENKETLSAYTYRRLVGGRAVEVVVSHSDPMQFTRVTLAKGPAEIYPTSTVNGRLDYDYETGNWYTDGLVFNYTVNGVAYTDRVTGSIKWIEDPDRATNGRGYYDFNLRFNEDANRAASTEADMFGSMSDEEAFFFVDDSIPTLTGRVSYVDSFIPGTDTPASSRVTYELHANKLTKQQVVNFFKLWMLAVGPVNDE